MLGMEYDMYAERTGDERDSGLVSVMVKKIRVSIELILTYENRIGESVSNTGKNEGDGLDGFEASLYQRIVTAKHFPFEGRRERSDMR